MSDGQTEVQHEIAEQNRCVNSDGERLSTPQRKDVALQHIINQLARIEMQLTTLGSTQAANHCRMAIESIHDPSFMLYL